MNELHQEKLKAIRLASNYELNGDQKSADFYKNVVKTYERLERLDEAVTALEEFAKSLEDKPEGKLVTMREYAEDKHLRSWEL